MSEPAYQETELKRRFPNPSQVRVVVGMSGGVDSSVTALLLKKQGFNVVGVFMKNWEEPGDTICPAETDAEDVHRVCDQIEIPYYTVNFTKQYYQKVFAYFLKEFECGRTPNPDVLCNREIKFGEFHHKALELGADMVATGHYARLTSKNKQFQLLRGQDPKKDQSYFLHALNQVQLRRAMFPIGHLLKSEVRKIAEQNELFTAKKKDSTGICFIGERNFKQFLSHYLPAVPGKMIDIHTGELKGEHDGLMYFTLGQRKGLGIGGTGTGEPWFVADKDLKTNTLYVAQGEEHPSLYSSALIATEVNWIQPQQIKEPFKCTAKFRYRQPDQEITVFPLSEKKYRVLFRQPQKAITPGQAVVFYQNEVCLGGGTIHQVHKGQI